MAKVLFTGRLVNDAEVITKETGFSTFSLAENIGFGDKQKTNFFKCKGNFSDAQLKYLTKGKSLDVIGELSTEISEANGKKYYNQIVKIIHFEFTPLPTKKEESEK